MRKNKTKVGIILAAMVLTATLSGCGEARKVMKQLELGNHYAAEQDYDSAITAYETAIAIDKYAIEGYKGLIIAMVNKGADRDAVKAKVQEGIAATKELAAQENGLTEEQRQAVESFYQVASDSLAGEERLDILDAGAALLGAESSVSDRYITEVKDIIQNYQDGKNFETAKEYADKLADALPDSEAAKDVTDQAEQQYHEEQKFVDTLLKAQAFITAQDWQGLADFCDGEEVAELAEKIGDVGNYTYLENGGDTGMGIGYYSMEGCDCNEWYYGNWENGKRVGQGGWYWAKNEEQGLYVDNYVGNWENDMPSGAGHEYMYGYEGALQEDRDVTVIDGLYDGTYTEEFVTSSGIHLTGNYTLIRGKYQPVEVEDWLKDNLPEGYMAFCVIPYTETDGQESVYWLRIPIEHDPVGVAHFR